MFLFYSPCQPGQIHKQLALMTLLNIFNLFVRLQRGGDGVTWLTGHRFTGPFLGEGSTSGLLSQVLSGRGRGTLSLSSLRGGGPSPSPAQGQEQDIPCAGPAWGRGAGPQSGPKEDQDRVSNGQDQDGVSRDPFHPPG